MIMKMKSGLPALFLLSSAMSFLYCTVVSRIYKHFTYHLAWEDAQAYCKESTYTDLAYFQRRSDAKKVQVESYYAWLCLDTRAEGNSWIWSNGRNLNGDNGNELDANGNCDLMAYIASHQSKTRPPYWYYGSNCERSYFFYCNWYGYYFVPKSMTWAEAREYCSSEYYNSTNWCNTWSDWTEQDFQVWIGLHRDGDEWQWASVYKSGDTNLQPPDADSSCVSITSESHQMSAENCLTKLPFVCYKDNLILVKENKTWEEAIEHCRAMGPLNYYNQLRHRYFHYDLVSVKPGQNHRYMLARIQEAKTDESQDCKTMKVGGWPRPPVNYCILIAMALSSSHTGSLNVQQIYNFTREHFPFFQTAPDGWKNTIRHNLCFSFCKTPHQLCRDGKRKSCLWHLTLDGRRRLRDEIHMLSGESFRELKRSMSHPDMVRTLFAL